ncbi:putative DD34D transposase [Trichonephila clavipes]|nr:putative DD34D transposase [Trichonephila clavipes]
MFWEAKGISLIDYLEKEACFEEETSETYKSVKKNIFHQDITTVHKGALVMGKLHDFGYDFLGFSSYSHDLAPTDFHLFPNMNKFDSGKHFTSTEKVKRATEQYLFSLPDSHFPKRVVMLGKHWTKCY